MNSRTSWGQRQDAAIFAAQAWAAARSGTSTTVMPPMNSCRPAFGPRVERGAKGWCDMNQNLKRSRLVLSRGASMVEYALLLVAVLLLAAGAMKALGPKVGQAAVNTTNML